MLTKNFKKLMNILLTGVGSQTRSGYIETRGSDGGTKYITGSVGSYPNSVLTNLSRSNTAIGIQVGTGNTPATEDDYKLESIITSGISGTVTYSFGADENDNPYVIYNVVINNNSQSNITIREIGFVQALVCSTTKGANSNNGAAHLLDRTVLDDPITIAPGDSKAIAYKFQSNINV